MHYCHVLQGLAAMTADDEQSQEPVNPAASVCNELARAVTSQVVQTGTIIGDIHQHATSDEVLRPRQLPPAPAWFIGRREELVALNRALDRASGLGGTVVITALAGTGGIGKTWLALHWAHQHLDRFPDGQLFVDLQGFSPSGQPTPTNVAVRGFLDALGVEPANIPLDLDSQIGRYRSLVAGKRMLVVLDNARNTEQVAPLLPGDSTCTVLVTSRNRLPGLAAAHGTQAIPIDVLSDAEAHDLLAARLGTNRITEERSAVEELIACCGRFPLALSIVAGRAECHPDFPLAMLVVELRDVTTRLGALDDGDPTASLPAVLSWSYQGLSAEQERVFELLGICPGPDISLPAVAGLTDLPLPKARDMLRALERVSLVQQDKPGRYRMHDLVRLCAASQAARNDLLDDERAMRRLTDFYLQTANNADLLLNPRRQPIEISLAATGTSVDLVPDLAAVFAWFEIEHPCLLAIQRYAVEKGWYAAAWQLAWTLCTFHQRQGRLHDDLATCQAAWVAARDQDDPHAQVITNRIFGRASGRAGKHAAAVRHLQQAVGLAKISGDLVNQAYSEYDLLWTSAEHGDDRQALEYAHRALELFQRLNDSAGLANAYTAVGWFSIRQGDYEQASGACMAGLELCRSQDYTEGEAFALEGLGYLAHCTGEYIKAADYLRQALAQYRKAGNAYNEAHTLSRLGVTYVALGQHELARSVGQQALQLYQEQRRTLYAKRIQRELDALDNHRNTTQW